MQIFLSTLSLRRATFCLGTRVSGIVFFYPRSPCGERLIELQCVLGRRFFYPRSPCGERQSGRAGISEQIDFLSTLSLRRATNLRCRCLPECTLFYPRSPCGERHRIRHKREKPRPFLSTLSLRRATRSMNIDPPSPVFSIHALLAESDVGASQGADSWHFSIHALLAESDAPSPPRQEFYKFSIHALLAESDY